MKSLPSLTTLLVATSSGLFGQSPLQIDWTTSLVLAPIVTSNGSALSLSEFSIELGGFANGFVPTSANIDEWVSNWRVFDAITDSEPPPESDSDVKNADIFVTDGSNSRFAGTGFLDVDQVSLSEDGNGIDTFGPGQQAYVFIRNMDDTLNPDTEFLLYTSETGLAFEFPAVTGGQADTNLVFGLDEVDTVLFGSANPNALDPNDAIVGDGSFTDMSTDFILRTHTVVPEPSTSLLLLGAGLGLLVRRRKS